MRNETAPSATDDSGTTSDEILLLFRLAPLVGEKGAVVVERVLRQLVKGNTRAYRCEINRLAGKFIASLEAAPPSNRRAG